jgi:large repetitive protein
LGPYCVGATPDVLPATSNNGITGSWNAPISTASSGTTTYTFTPDPGQCASQTTMNILVDTEILPTFTQLGPYCVGDTPGTLPTVSNNGITGSWNAAVSTATAGTTTYIFTADAGQCATGTSMNIVVQSPVTPTFNPVADVCQGATAPVLPTTSLNGISGTWSPAVSTATAGTFTYTFTPNAGQCATSTTLDITVSNSITPSFNPLADVCRNAPAPVLPTTSLNGISGTWSPAVSTATAGTFTYTFTPSAGQCATTTTLTLTVIAPTVPTFNTLTPVCQGAAAPVLPTNSLNGITGTWSPAVSTSTIGTFTYTFTPSAGQCATTATLSLTVTDPITPTFNPVADVCQGAPAPVLPATSLNGISGTWSPAVSTSTPGTTTYVFTPTAGQCAVSTTLTIRVTAPVNPAFTFNTTYCLGDNAPALPAASNNGITGSWSPASISTASAGTTTYTFTPNPGQCANVVTTNVTITQPLVPDFPAFDNVCQGYDATLPTVSPNGVSGAWTPAPSSSVAGTFTYTFVPSLGQCAQQITRQQTILPSDTSTQESITCFASEAGISYITLSNSQGCDSVIMQIRTLVANNYAVSPDFVSMRAGESFEYTILNEDSNLEYSWVSTDGQSCASPCNSYVVTATQNTTRYFFTFTNTETGCVNSDTLRIDLEYFSELNVPNIFTPNNDGQNDVYRVYGTDIFDYNIKIYDRWGGLIFETSELTEGWDGNFKGKPVQSGIYVAVIQATGLDTKRYEIKQNIKLVR